jgi:hypothetical protein
MKTKVIVPVLLLASVLVSAVVKVNAQDLRSVSGVVTSFRNIPLNNAKVFAGKSGEIALTDSSGAFTVKCLKKDILTVSASGFNVKKQKVRKDSFYNINLAYEDNVKNFNDAVSHGHISGEALKNALLNTGPANAKDYSKYKSIYEAISSEIYNVRVNGTTILNTKVRSFDRTPEVLLVVDDKVVRDISYINPDYVKSIEFIDDVGTTMYGAMGANGVIKITLK